MLSFVIPSYNSAEYLHPAIDSCLQQTIDCEIVVVDDHSTDSTSEYIAWAKRQEWASKVKFIRNEKNLGRSASRNIGNAAATGDIICVLDADDICIPTRAELTLAKFKAGADVVHGAAHMMDPVGRDLGLMPTDVFNLQRAIESKTAGVVHSTLAYRREIALKNPYQGGDVARLGVDDFCLVMSLASQGLKFDYIPTPISAYRTNPHGITSTRNQEDVEAFKKGYIESLEAMEVAS